MTTEPVRRREHTWDDPMTTASAAATMGGLDLLRAVFAGELPPPPVMSTLAMHGVSVEAGRVVFGFVPQEFHYNPIGSVHGGVLATLLDSAMGCAVHSRLAVGTGYTTLDLSVRYLRAVTTRSGEMTCEGTVVSLGRRTATAEARVLDASGRVFATATTGCLVFPLGQ